MYANWNTARERDNELGSDGMTVINKRTAHSDGTFSRGERAAVTVVCIPCMVNVSLRDGELETESHGRGRSVEHTKAKRERAEEDHS